MLLLRLLLLCLLFLLLLLLLLLLCLLFLLLLLLLCLLLLLLLLLLLQACVLSWPRPAATQLLNPGSLLHAQKGLAHCITVSAFSLGSASP